MTIFSPKKTTMEVGILITRVFRSARRRWKARFGYKEFGDYSEAATASGVGYENEDLADVIVLSGEKFFDRMDRGSVELSLAQLRPLIALASIESQGSIRVLDFGGGFGSHYAVARRVMEPAQDFQWLIVETAAMVARARKSSLGEKGLSWFTSVSDALSKSIGVPDLVLSIGTLPYTPDPLVALQELVDIGAPNLCLMRVGLSDTEKTRYIAQVSSLRFLGGGDLPVEMKDATVGWPATFVSKVRFKQIIEVDYEITLEFLDESNSYRVGKSYINMYGFLARRRA